MVQDVNIDDDPDQVIASPASTPGLSPFGQSADDYFQTEESFSARQRRTGSVRGYSGSILTRRDTIPKPKRKPLERLHTEVLLRMVLQDAQTRLVFRAQALLRADVEYYVPKDGDLDYPGEIQGERAQRKLRIKLMTRWERRSHSETDVRLAGSGRRRRAGVLHSPVGTSPGDVVSFSPGYPLDPFMSTHLYRCKLLPQHTRCG